MQWFSRFADANPVSACTIPRNSFSPVQRFMRLSLGLRKHTKYRARSYLEFPRWDADVSQPAQKSADNTA